MDRQPTLMPERGSALTTGRFVAPRAGEMIHELSVAIALSAKADQVAGVVHAFPTFSEAVQAACAQV